ncbi:hypothetical protein GA0115240_11862 [Streptomyces sp. DvalAA-14]|uniref:hypothetical protein n=1 Tax=unclassified Streptomyces TaxID=2593676 RepID=UPI00081B1738|nr:MULTISPECIES: hypothetical protein [unclassified Streptomyces]MYS20325.1 hypothetical protein [Streptomyces sp. SID4948]SCD66333.1 hypothetical protein GA0115240_11862 [Streptomyces sp. DvalAA-14]
MNPAVDRLTARCLGTALAVAACNPPAAFRGPGLDKALVVLVAAVAWWAAPMADERPVRASLRWQAIALHRRSTLLAGGSVVIAAVADPPVWLAGCVTALLLAYLLVTDPWTAGVTAPPGPRPLGPPLIAAAACAIVFLLAQAPVAGTSWSRLPAALAVAATAVCLGLALLRRGTARRPG